ncbi:MAG: hypothetical protein HYX71_09300 [Opitutae bacterium]|nr:hypothetical protein [Opitutae bacterium]
MSRLLKLAALLLAALWLPATAHCGLEAAGLLVKSSACAAAVDCAGDGCRQVEEGFFKQSAAALKVLAPELLACDCLRCLQLVAQAALVAAADFSPVSFERPQSWVTRWTFERRAALPARAPSPALT